MATAIMLSVSHILSYNLCQPSPLLTALIEKLLDTLSAPDYAQFLEYLQPEMIKAKRIISGKQVLSVCNDSYSFLYSRNANSQLRLRKRCIDLNGLILSQIWPNATLSAPRRWARIFRRQRLLIQVMLRAPKAARYLARIQALWMSLYTIALAKATLRHMWLALQMLRNTFIAWIRWCMTISASVFFRRDLFYTSIPSSLCLNWATLTPDGNGEKKDAQKVIGVRLNLFFSSGLFLLGYHLLSDIWRKFRC